MRPRRPSPHLLPLLLAVAIAPFTLANTELSNLKFSAFTFNLDATTCSMGFSGNISATATLTSDTDMSTLPSISVLNFTVLQSTAGHLYEAFSIDATVLSLSGTLTSPLSASLSLSLSVSAAPPDDRVHVDRFGVNFMGNGTVFPVTQGVALVHFTPTTTRYVALAGTTTFSGLGWLSHNPGKISGVAVSQLLSSTSLELSTTVTYSNPNPLLGFTMNGVCARLTVSNLPSVANTTACLAGVATASCPPASSDTTFTLSETLPLPTTATSDAAVALSHLFSGPSQTIGFGGSLDPAADPCFATGTALLPRVSQTLPSALSFLIDEVQLRVAPYAMGKPTGAMGYTLKNPIAAAATVSMTSLEVFDNSSTLMFKLAGPDTTALSLSASGTASTTTPKGANLSYIVPPSNSSYRAFFALTQLAEPVYLPVRFTAEIRMFDKSAPISVTSQTVVVRVIPRVTPQGGCTSSDQCLNGFCVPGLKVCSSDPTTGCNATSVPCGVGGVVLPLNGSTRAAPKCMCKCVAPCFTGTSCATVDASLSSCTASAVQAFGQAMDSGCGAQPQPLPPLTTHPVDAAATAPTAVGLAAPDFPGGKVTLGVGHGYTLPGSIQTIAPVITAPFSPGSLPPSHGGHQVPQSISFTTNPTAAPSYSTITYTSVRDVTPALSARLSAMKAGVAPWRQVFPSQRTISDFANDLRDDAMSAFVSQSFSTVSAELNSAAEAPVEYNSCVRKHLLQTEALLVAGASTAATASVQKFIASFGHYVTVAAELGGTATQEYRPPYYVTDNVPPGQTPLSSAELDASALAQFNTISGMAAPGAAMSPEYKAAVPPPSEDSSWCSGGVDLNCLTDNSAWQSSARQPGVEGVVSVKVARWDAFLTVPKTADAIEAAADALVASTNNVNACRTCKDATGTCSATAAACVCRDTSSPPYSGAGAYGRNCDSCSSSFGGGFAWFPYNGKDFCVNGVSYAGNGCGACPIGSTMTALEPADEMERQRHEQHLQFERLPQHEQRQRYDQRVAAMQQSQHHRLRQLRGEKVTEEEEQAGDTTTAMVLEKGQEPKLGWPWDCHRNSHHCNEPTVLGFHATVMNTQCSHDWHGWFCGSGNDNDNWQMTYAIAK